MRLLPALAFAALLLDASPLNAQDLPGDPVAGLEFARQICAECHYVERQWADLYVHEAPSFIDVAENSDHNEMSLRVFFVTPHLTMPNLRLTDEQTDNVISWILSLRED
ncbi:MAG: cytochrome C [Pseudomonadota bacterium]